MTGTGRWTDRAMALGLALTAVLSPGVAVRADEHPKIEVVPRIPHAGRVTSAAFSPDGARVVTGSEDATLKLWDVATGRLIRTLARHSNEVVFGVTAVFSPDGTRVLSGSTDGLRLWDIASGRLIRAVNMSSFVQSSAVTSLAFSPDGKRVLAGLLGGRAELWDATAWQRLQTFQHGENRLGEGVDALAFSPDGALVLTGGRYPVAKLWDAATGKLVREFGRSRAEGLGSIDTLAFSPDGARVALGVSQWERSSSVFKGSLELWDAATGELIHTLPARQGRIAFSKDGTLVLGNSDGLMAADFKKDRLTPIVERRGRAVALSTDGTRVLSDSPTLTILDVKTGREVHLQDPSYVLRLKSLAVSPDGEHVLTGGQASASALSRRAYSDNAISLWDAASGRLIRTSRIPQGEELATLAFSPEGGTAFSNSLVSFTQWNATTGEPIRSIRVGRDPLLPRIPIDFAADGTHLVAASGKTVLLWDLATATAPRSFEGDARLVYSVAISPDGTRVAAGSDDGKVRIWNAATGGLLHTFDVSWAWQLQRYIVRFENPITALAFSPDGMQLAAARHGFDDDLKRMRLWNVASGNLVRTFDFQPGRIGSVAISPDGTRLLSGGDISSTLGVDVPFRLWDVASGRLIHSFDGPSGGGSAVAFSRDGQRVFSTSHDGTTRVWDTGTGALLTTLLAAADDGWLAVTTEGFFDASTETVATELLSIVRGLEVSPITASTYEILHRPDLVRAKLASDPGGKTKAAAAELDAKLAVK